MFICNKADVHDTLQSSLFSCAIWAAELVEVDGLDLGSVSVLVIARVKLSGSERFFQIVMWTNLSVIGVARSAKRQSAQAGQGGLSPGCFGGYLLSPASAPSKAGVSAESTRFRE